MCGFLLRTVLLSVILYLLLGIESATHIVTLGGQILGAAAVGLLTAVYHVFVRHFFVHQRIGRIVAAIWSGLTVIVIVKILPGYKVVDATLFSYVVSVFCLISWATNYLIKDK